MRKASSITIDIANQQACLPVDRVRWRRAVRAILKDASITRARISLAVVDDPTMARLNEQFLDHKGPTDVLSFVLDKSEGFVDGEVIVGAETALRESPRYGATPSDELLLYVVHGTLHLVGYDDTTVATRRKMRKREQEVLQALGPKGSKASEEVKGATYGRGARNVPTGGRTTGRLSHRNNTLSSSPPNPQSPIPNP
jgi:probable rRNA maturation factor